MDRRKWVAAWVVISMCLVSFPGCGWWSAQADNGVEEDLTETSADAVPPASLPDLPARPQQAAELILKASDRFPLMKTVEHTLRQPSPQGWTVSRSTLEMLLSLTVAEIRQVDRLHAPPDSRSGQKRVQVKFHRLRFLQELPGQPRVEYDSNAPSFPVPQGAEGYHGMKNNGFEFWLTAENQLSEVVGFDQFLQRCLNEVSPEKRQQVRAAMAVASGADGLATFVDDSIGLLPAPPLHEGDVWTRDRQVGPPVPLSASTRYTLRRLSSETAEIDVQGTLSPSGIYVPANQSNRDVRVSVRGGRTVGYCLVDLGLGLPLESRVEQTLDMNVRLADGSEFDQYKSTLTTIRRVPGQGNSQAPNFESALPLDPPPRVSQGGGDGLGGPGKIPPRR